LVQYFDFTDLAFTYSPLFYFRHYVEHTEQGCVQSLDNWPLFWSRLNCFHFWRGSLLVDFFCSLIARFGILISQNRVHVKRALLLSTIFGNLISRNRQAHCSSLCFTYGIFGGHLLGNFYRHFDWFSISISRNWRSRTACFFTFFITSSTQNRVVHEVSKICPILGQVELFSFLYHVSTQTSDL